MRDKFAPDFVNGEEHQVMSPTDLVHQISPVGSELDWMEPSVLMCNSKMLQPYGSERVYDAFHLLRTEPLVQVPFYFFELLIWCLEMKLNRGTAKCACSYSSFLF